MKPAIIRICYIKDEKVVEVIHNEVAYLITADKPKHLMRNARKYAKANGYKITDIIII